jgi:hypothetical protein
MPGSVVNRMKVLSSPKKVHKEWVQPRVRACAQTQYSSSSFINSNHQLRRNEGARAPVGQRAFTAFFALRLSTAGVPGNFSAKSESKHLARSRHTPTPTSRCLLRNPKTENPHGSDTSTPPVTSRLPSSLSTSRDVFLAL